LDSSLARATASRRDTLRLVPVGESVRPHREDAGEVNIVGRKGVFLEPGNAVPPIKIVLYDCCFVFSFILILGFNCNSRTTRLGKF